MNLVTFGDSWPWGAELQDDEKPYGYWIANELNLEFRNYSNEGTTIEHMILQLDEYIKNNKDDTIAIFFVTNPIRAMYHDGKNFVSHRPTVKSKKTNLYYETLQSDILDNHRSNVFVLALQKMCSKFKIKDYYLEGWSNIKWNLQGIDLEKFYNKTAMDILGAQLNNRTIELSKYQQNKYIKPNKYHPNENGHKKIAEELSKWICL